MTGKVAITFFMLAQLGIGIVVIIIGVKESETSSLLVGSLIVAAALAFWYVLALKMRADNKKHLAICFLLSLIPWDL